MTGATIKTQQNTRVYTGQEILFAYQQGYWSRWDPESVRRVKIARGEEKKKRTYEHIHEPHSTRDSRRQKRANGNNATATQCTPTGTGHNICDVTLDNKPNMWALS